MVLSSIKHLIHSQVLILFIPEDVKDTKNKSAFLGGGVVILHSSVRN